MNAMTELSYDEIEKIIRSAVGRVVHDTPSKETRAMIEELQKNDIELGKKIDDLTDLVKNHNVKHEKDMEEIMPIIQEYRDKVAVQNFTFRWSDRIRSIASTITALGIIGALGYWIIHQVK